MLLEPVALESLMLAMLAAAVSGLNDLRLNITSDYQTSDICADFFKPVRGTIFSPHYPLKYPRRANCRHIISAPPGHVIAIHFIDFAMELSKNCEYDFFEVRDGPFGYSPKLAQLCGKGHQRPIISSGQHVWMRMKTDDLIEDRGIHAMVEAYKDGGDITRRDMLEDRGAADFTNCYLLINASAEGTISTAQGMPTLIKWLHNNTKTPTDCSWDIRTDINARLFLMFSEFTVASSELSWQCPESTLEIYDGGTSVDDIVLRKDCFTRPTSFITRSSRVIVRLQAARAAASLSFTMTYTTYYSGNACIGKFSCGHGHCVDKSLECNGVDNCRDTTDEYCQADSSDDKERMVVSWKYPLVLGVAASATLFLISGVLVHNARLRYVRHRKSVASVATTHEQAATHPVSSRSHLGRQLETAESVSSAWSERELLSRGDGGLPTQCSACGDRRTRIQRSQTMDSAVTVRTLLSTSNPTEFGTAAQPCFVSPTASIEEDTTDDCPGQKVGTTYGSRGTVVQTQRGHGGNGRLHGFNKLVSSTTAAARVVAMSSAAISSAAMSSAADSASANPGEMLTHKVAFHFRPLDDASTPQGFDSLGSIVGRPRSASGAMKVSNESEASVITMGSDLITDLPLPSKLPSERTVITRGVTGPATDMKNDDIGETASRVSRVIQRPLRRGAPIDDMIGTS